MLTTNKFTYPLNHRLKEVVNNVSREWRTVIAEIRQWMTLNLLKLNDDKTEFILFGTRQQLSKLDTIPVLIAIGDTMVSPSGDGQKSWLYHGQIAQKYSPH